MHEIEVRAKCPGNIEKILEKTGAKKVSQTKEYDEYYKFGKDDERRIVMRFRKKGSKTILTFKGSSKLKEDVAWQEWENKITRPEILKNLLLSNGCVHVVTIDKTRTTYNLEDFEINVDSIKGLGEFIEVELKSNQLETARQRIMDFIKNQLEISEQDIITKGYVPLMIEKIQSNQ